MWPLKYSNLTVKNKFADLNRYPVEFTIDSMWILIKPSIPDLQMRLNDLDRDTIYLPTISKDGYLLFLFDSLYLDRKLSLEILNAKCKSFTLDYYTAGCVESPEKFFNFYIENLGDLFAKQELKAIALAPSFDLNAKFGLDNGANCKTMKFSATVKNSSISSDKILGFTLKGDDRLKASTATILFNNLAISNHLSDDTIFLDEPLFIQNETKDSLAFEFGFELDCQWLDDHEFTLDIFTLNQCGEEVSFPFVFPDVDLFKMNSETPPNFELVVREVKDRCGSNLKILLDVISDKPLKAGEGLIVTLPLKDRYKAPFSKNSLDSIIVALDSKRRMWLDIRKNFGAYEPITIEMGYEKYCSSSCEPATWKLEYLQKQPFECDMSCFVLANQIDRNVEIDLSLRLRDLGLDTIVQDISTVSFSFEKTNATYNDSVLVELYSDINRDGFIDENDILITQEKSLLSINLDRKPTINIDVSNGRACKVIALITASCSCDSLIIPFELIQPDPSPLVYPVCLIEPLGFNLPSLNFKNVVWPQSPFLSETNNTGGIYNNPAIESNDTIRIKFVDEYGCLLDFPLVFTPGIKDLEVLSRYENSCTDSVKAFLSLNTSATINKFSLDGMTIEDYSNLPLSEGNHTIVIVDNLNCAVQRYLDVAIPSSPIINVTDILPTTCFDKDDGSISFSTVGGSESIKFYLNGAEIFQDTLISDLASGTYQLEAIDSLECRDTVVFDIGRADKVGANQDTLVAYCGENFVNLEGISFVGGDSLSFSADGINFGDETKNFVIGGEQKLLEIYSKDVNGCIYRFEFNLIHEEKVEIITSDTIVDYGQSISLAIENESDFRTLEWNSDLAISCNACLQPTLEVLESGIVTLIAEDINGCIDTGQINIKLTSEEFELVLPNILKINSGNSNDHITLQVRDPIVEISSFEIYDRMGNLVYIMPEGGQVMWNGKMNGTNCVPGVFVYKSEMKIKSKIDVKERTFYGTITLVN